MPEEATGQSESTALLRQPRDVGREADWADAEREVLSRLASVGSLASMLAHEMNNILTPVLNYATLALEAPANEALARRAHESTIRGVLACQDMARSLLGFAVPTEPISGGANVAASVERAIGCLPRPLSKDRIDCIIDAEADLVCNISATSLEQVILNLLLNAREVLPAGGRIEIRAWCSTWNVGRRSAIEIEFRDSGPGIPADQRERVFQPFVSLDGRREGGAGLGLSICRHLIEAAGGRMIVADDAASGACFRITLPAADELAARVA